MKQLDHYEISNHQQEFPIAIICDPLRTPENVGMCFRVAENFGVHKICFHESSPKITNKIVKRTARSTINRIRHDSYKDLNTMIRKLKSEDHRIIGIEITDKSIDVQDFNFKNHQKIALLLGNERNGIENMGLLDDCVSIPMYGRNTSMNVIHSLSIVLYEATNQLKNRGIDHKNNFKKK